MAVDYAYKGLDPSESVIRRGKVAFGNPDGSLVLISIISEKAISPTPKYFFPLELHMIFFTSIQSASGTSMLQIRTRWPTVELSSQRPGSAPLILRRWEALHKAPITIQRLNEMWEA